MRRIERPAIRANGGIVAALLDDVVRAVVAGRAQAMQCAQAKLVEIAAMLLDVISHLSGRYFAIGQAHPA